MLVDLVPAKSVSAGGTYDQEIHTALDMGACTDLSLRFHIWEGSSQVPTSAERSAR